MLEVFVFIMIVYSFIGNMIVLLLIDIDRIEIEKPLGILMGMLLWPILVYVIIVKEIKKGIRR